jgi:predicted nucleotidyltransferase
MLNLDAEHLRKVQAILKQYVPNMTIWAYGSRIQGKAHAGSDLDLVIINLEHPYAKQENLTLLRTAFHDSTLPIQVEILDWAAIPSTFQNEIKNAYVVLQTGQVGT